jgi:hypothetical protein
MSEKEKEIIRKVAQALPDMSDMNKGYFLGFAEAMVSRKKHESEEENEKKDNI